jgi:hypothetical protein
MEAKVGVICTQVKDTKDIQRPPEVAEDQERFSSCAFRQ